LLLEYADVLKRNANAQNALRAAFWASDDEVDGIADEADDSNLAERFAGLKAEFEAQLAEEAALNRAIAENLARVTYADKSDPNP
jgi:hypothetical protein